MTARGLRDALERHFGADCCLEERGTDRSYWLCPVCGGGRDGNAYPLEVSGLDGPVKAHCDACHCGVGEVAAALNGSRQAPSSRTEDDQATTTEPEDPIEPTAEPSPGGNGSMGALWVPGEEGAGVDKTAARARVLDVRVGEWSGCVIPDHEHQARLHPTAAGYWQYTCAGTRRGYGLAEVRAFLGYGSVRAISPTLCARWRELLDYEAGLRVPRSVPALPDGLPEDARRVGERWRLLVGLRDERFGDAPFIFAREFVMAYCGVGNERARRAVKALERAGVMRRVGRTLIGRCWAIEWRPATSGETP